jgi:hypothetical protein
MPQTRNHNPTTQKRSYRTGTKTHRYLIYFMTARATMDAERAANPRFPERHTSSAPEAKQTAEEKNLERRQREEEEDESRRGFAASERCVGDRGERGRFRK